MKELKGKSPKILVIGDLIVDHYLWGSSKRISPEAPVQIVDINQETTLLGGAGNVANNLHTLGAKVDIISVIGNDSAGATLKKLFKNISINTKYLISLDGRVTSKKTRIISAQQQVIRFDKESIVEIDKKVENLIIGNLENIINNYECVLLSDYGKGLLTNTLTQSIIKLSNKNNKKVLVDPKGSDYSKYRDAFLLTPNKSEASKATNIDIIDDQTLIESITKLKSNLNLSVSLITLSELGIATYDRTLQIYPTATKEVFDVTGAGDTVLASIGFAIACNENFVNVIKFANLAAGFVVGKIGSASATFDEIIEYELSLKNSFSDQHIKTQEEIKLLTKQLKEKGKKIIFTNGCFDLIHAGHIKYLETAKDFGDILIVGLNSDHSVSLLKGANRPINSENDRAYILAALEVVDYVVIFKDKTPYDLIKDVKPHILVKGGDYKNKKVVGSDIVDELKIVDFITDKSTTKTIEKIRRN